MNSDEPKIFHVKERYVAMASEARGILILLGFDGVWDFAKRAGINHDTAGQLLGTVKVKHKKKHNLVVQAHEALHSAYMQHRAVMSSPKLAYIKDWVKRWKQWVLDEVLWLESPGRVVKKKYVYQDRQVAKRRAAIKAGVEQALNALEWN